MRWLLACVLLVTSSLASANGPIFGEIQIGGGAVSHSDLDFFPILGSVSVGAYVLPGIGVELFADTGIDAGDDAGFDLNLDSAYGLGIRFESPPQSGLQGFVVLGAVNYTLEQDSSAGSSVSGDFTGVRASVGVMQRLTRFPNLLVTAEYRHYNADEPLRIDALLVGLRVNTP